MYFAHRNLLRQKEIPEALGQFKGTDFIIFIVEYSKAKLYKYIWIYLDRQKQQSCTNT